MRVPPCAAGSRCFVRLAGHADRDEDRQADDHPEEIGRDAKQVESVLQDGQKQHAEHHAAHEPIPPTRLAPPRIATASTLSSLPAMAVGTAWWTR